LIWANIYIVLDENSHGKIEARYDSKNRNLKRATSLVLAPPHQPPRKWINRRLLRCLVHRSGQKWASRTELKMTMTTIQPILEPVPFSRFSKRGLRYWSINFQDHLQQQLLLVLVLQLLLLWLLSPRT
jgi:hypothetical protein